MENLDDIIRREMPGFQIVERPQADGGDAEKTAVDAVSPSLQSLKEKYAPKGGREAHVAELRVRFLNGDKNGPRADGADAARSDDEDDDDDVVMVKVAPEGKEGAERTVIISEGRVISARG
jgi:hypothetical protein